MHSMLLKKKTKYNFGIFMNPYFSSLINREQNNKITGNVIKFDKRKGYGFISTTQYCIMHIAICFPHFSLSYFSLSYFFFKNPTMEGLMCLFIIQKFVRV